MPKKVVVVGSGNAALSAGIAALEKGADVVIYEKADKKMAGGNTKYTAGAMRFSYENGDQLIDLLKHPDDKRIKDTDWVFSTWRSHYHALIKGVDPKWLEEKIYYRDTK